MPKCTDARIDFGRLGRRVIEADFSGGDLSSDGGLLLLRQVDEYLQPAELLAAHRDHRHPPPPQQPQKAALVTSLSVRRVTSVSVTYKNTSQTQYYKKLVDGRSQSTRPNSMTSSVRTA